MVVDLFKNLGGLSYIRNISDFHDMNIRKYQMSLGILAPPPSVIHKKKYSSEICEASNSENKQSDISIVDEVEASAEDNNSDYAISS